MELKEALSKLKPDPKNRESYITLKVGYGDTFIVPHKEGMMIIDALSQAQKYDEGYSNPPSLRPMRSADISMAILSEEEYKLIKIALLMKVPLKDLSAIEIPF